MSLQERIAEIRRVVEDARSMPMSASAVVNRAEMLALLDDLSETARTELAEAAHVVSAKDEVVGAGQARVDELLAQARDEQQRLASDTEVQQRARQQADELLSAAQQEAEARRKEADDYVDAKLAGFEVALERSLETVRRGRERLAGAPGSFDLGSDDVRLPEHLEG